MAKRLSYHTQTSINTNERLKALQRELPILCTDYFRAISQTTSALTRLAYAYDLRLFFQYLTAELVSFANSIPSLMQAEDLARITARDIAGFQEYLQQYVKEEHAGKIRAIDEDSSPILVQNHEFGTMRKLSCVRSFFDYLFKQEIVPANVAAMITLPKLHVKPILYLEPHEVQKLMDTVLTGTGLSQRQQKLLNHTRLRDIAILMLFLGTGIRVSELVGIDIDDLDLNASAFMVTRKGGNQSILYYPDEVKAVIQAYLEFRDKVDALPGSEHALFLSLQRRRITDRAVENLVKKFAQVAAPLKKKISPHKLRSTFGTGLYQETGDIYLVAEALGHSDINTTKRHYAAMQDSRKREAAERIVLPDLHSTDADLLPHEEKDRKG